jgi:DNA invertase Pin-like site-specific DNA recombinase
MNAIPLRWVSWAAVSSLPQAKKISIEDQLAVNREHIERHGGQLVEELIIPGESRSIVLFEDAASRIPAYARLHELVQQRAFDVLVYLDRSRLGRKASLSMTVVELCQAAGIATYETENPPSEVKAGQGHDEMLVGAIKSVGAQREIQKLMERNTIGMIGRIKKGEPANHIVYGYMREFAPDGSSHILINEPAAAVVREIFDLYMSGVGAPTIATLFNERGILTPNGREWSKIAAIRVMDRVWRYAGYTEINRESKTGRPYVRARGNWDPIISESMAEEFVKEREARRHNRHLPDATDKLTSVCYCMVCGKPMTINRPNAPVKGGLRRYSYYRCDRQKPFQFVRSDYVAAFMRNQLEMLQGQELSALFTELEEGPSPLAAQVEAQEQAVNRMAAALQRVDDAYAMGVLDLDRYQRQVEKIQAQMSGAEKERERLNEGLSEEMALGTQRQRLEDLARDGLTMLLSDEIPPRQANIFFRHRVRLWVTKGSIINVEWL